MKKHKKVSTKVTRNATIPHFGRVGVDLDPNAPRWANRQVSALASAMAVIENLELNARELEFLQETFLPRLISERSADFMNLVKAPSPAAVAEKAAARVTAKAAAAKAATKVAAKTASKATTRVALRLVTKKAA